MSRLRRKIDQYLIDWKNDENKMPLIVKGARQIGKTDSIRNFAENNYKYLVEINFALEKQYLDIFDDGFSVDSILKNISFKNPDFNFIPNETLIFFDELQACPNCATSLKAFKEDGRFDVICSGSLMRINYNEIESNSVGNKIDYDMYSMDFEEFLWAKGYKEEQIEDIYKCMLETKPLSTIQYDVMMSNFKEYMVVGGMPAIVDRFVTQKNYSGILEMQKQILLDYEEDITKYARGLDQGRVLSVYRKIISYCMEQPELPLGGNFNPDNYRLYFADTGILIGSLDEEAQDDLRRNENFNTYKGAIYENIVGDMLVKAGYKLYFYKNEKGTLEMDFFIRDKDSLIPVEVKANDNATTSLNKLIDSNKYKDLKYGIKLCNKNIGFNGKFYTFPYFLTFLLKRYLRERN